MKTIKFLMLAVLLISLTNIGCKKEATTQAPTQKISNEDAKLASMATSFKSKLESPLKAGELMEVDSAVWYMKLTANFNYGDASAKNDDVSIKEVKFPLDNSNGMISLSAVENLYDAIIDSVSIHYTSIGASEKALSYVNIVIDTLHSAAAPDEYQLNVTSVVTSNLMHVPWSFGPTDHWWWADGGGKCDSYGGYLGKDAATQLEYMFQISRSCPEWGYWLPELTIHEVATNFPASTSPTNNCGWYMFKNSSELPGFHKCIPPNEMNFYLNGLELIGNSLLLTKYGLDGQGYYCIGININTLYSYTACQGQITSEYLQHDSFFIYSKPHYNPGPGPAM